MEFVQRSEAAAGVDMQAGRQMAVQNGEGGSQPYCSCNMETQGSATQDGGGEAGDGGESGGGDAAAGGTINRENVLRKLKCWLDVNTASQAGNAIFAEKDGGTALLWCGVLQSGR